MNKAYYISGEWNLECDVCSKKIKAHEARQRWDGLMVCTKDYEIRWSELLPPTLEECQKFCASVVIVKQPITILDN